MPEKDYSHRDVLDKLGIKPEHSVAFAMEGQEIDSALQERILERIGRAAIEDEALDIVLAFLNADSNPVEILERWKSRLKPTGSIWLLTAKRNQPGYLDQNELIEAGKQAGVVDNKVCSISSSTSAMRFVIRKKDR
jgi:Protein of unknown function (DUF3052)